MLLSGNVFIDASYEEVILPAIWEQQTFVEKAGGSEILSQMWAFQDKGERDVCLIPEGTALIQETFNQDWAKRLPKPLRIFYVTRCYRYEKPQLGRYREFTQFGVELLGGKPGDKEEVEKLLKTCLVKFEGLDFNYVPAVKRGLTYYTEDGFEVECPCLGSQKQVAGGGRYREGIGWAIGVERLMLAIKNSGDK